jgi:hypothetical protein
MTINLQNSEIGGEEEWIGQTAAASSELTARPAGGLRV